MVLNINIILVSIATKFAAPWLSVVLPSLMFPLFVIHLSSFLLLALDWIDLHLFIPKKFFFISFFVCIIRYLLISHNNFLNFRSKNLRFWIFCCCCCCCCWFDLLLWFWSWICWSFCWSSHVEYDVVVDSWALMLRE